MIYRIVRTEEEIDSLLNACSKRIDRGGSAYPGMTFEQGINDAIMWLTGQNDDHPYPEEDDDDE